MRVNYVGSRNAADTLPTIETGYMRPKTKNIAQARAWPLETAVASTRPSHYTIVVMFGFAKAPRAILRFS